MNEGRGMLGNVESHVSELPCSDVRVHLCHVSYVSLREHNQVVLLQIKSGACL